VLAYEILACTTATGLVQIGRLHLILVEGEGKGSSQDSPIWTGRTDTNKRVTFDLEPVLLSPDMEIDRFYEALVSQPYYSTMRPVGARGPPPSGQRHPTSALFCSPGLVSKGSYALVRITSARGHTLKGTCLAPFSISQWSSLKVLMDKS